MSFSLLPLLNLTLKLTHYNALKYEAFRHSFHDLQRACTPVFLRIFGIRDTRLHVKAGISYQVLELCVCNLLSLFRSVSQLSWSLSGKNLLMALFLPFDKGRSPHLNLAMFSDLWHVTHDSLCSYFLASNECRANRLKGSKIRVGPRSVLFNAPTAHRDIYNYKANVTKDKSYDAWRRNEGDVNTLNTTDVAVHARKRKLLNTVFTEKSVRSAAAFIIKHLNRWNELSVTGHEWSEPIDFSKWTDCLIFDILGDLCFGKSLGIKEPGENSFKMIPDVIGSYMRLWYPV